MCCYKFYTQALKDEIVEKMDELLQENEISSRYDMSRIHSYQTEQMYEVEYEIEAEKKTCDEGVAHVLSDVMQKKVIQNVCDRFLRSREDLTKQERHEITQAFMMNNYLSRQEGISYVTYYFVYLPIYKEIGESSSLNIEGWLQFRLGKYRTLLTDILEQFVEDYVAKKDVVNFIRIMREASLLAVPLEEVIHVVYKKEGKIQIYDKNKKNVTGHYIKKYCKDLLLDSTLTREDLLLHVLITISPKKIIVHKNHNMKSKQFMNTIEIIFDENITYCEGCTFCQKEE
ncbi:MAG: hypothetical protein E7231_02200 [Cellulosilyticum sp.]|nr:hypothetical protein [Cellulosilyticum sp.]